MIRLNLASGTDIKRGDGWINLDAVFWPTAESPPDVIWDARKDKIPYGSNTVDEIYAGYLLLHLAPNWHPFVLSEIVRVLKPGAKVVFGEVDMRIVLQRWLANPMDADVSGLIWGEQGVVAHGVNMADWDKHCWGFDEHKLRTTIRRAGLRDGNRFRIHHPDVYYEMTIEAFKP